MNAQSLQNLLNGKIDKVVALDGSGDYTSVQEALNSVPNNSSNKTVIYIKNGTYVEKVEIAPTKNNLVIIGESVDSTIISYDDYSGSGEIYNGIITSKVGEPIGTSTSHTMYIDSYNVLIMNLTIENSAGKVGQAVATNLGGDRTTIIGCRILGNQDTFYTWGYGRFYMRDTYVEGNVDFIFGRGVALFDSCQINSNRSSSDITAASTDEGWTYGYVFNRCRVTSNPNITGVSMGRPWKTYAQTVFINSFLNSHIKSAGWSDWDGRSATCYYAEYNNFGPGYKPESRVSWAHILTEAEASNYTINNLFAKEVSTSFSSDWLPSYESDSVYIIYSDNTTLLLSDTTFNKPLLTGIKYNDSIISNFDPLTAYYYVELPYGTVEMPEITAYPLDPLAIMEIEYPLDIPGSVVITVTARNKSTRNYNVSFTIATSENKLNINDPLKFNLVSNPVKDCADFIFQGRRDDRIDIMLLNSAGSVVAQEIFTITNREQRFLFDISILPAGIYYFYLRSNDTIGNGKLVKIE